MYQDNIKEQFTKMCIRDSLRSCEIHSLKRIDDIYLRNGFEDIYYKKMRERAKFVLIGCEKSFENCFCVSMGSNKTDEYNACLLYTS